MILRNLWRRKTRTLLTTLGIAVGVAAVVALSAFGEGLATGFEKAFATPDADLTLSQKDALMSFLSVLDEEIGEQAREVPGVEQVVGTVAGILQFPSAPYFIVKGEEPQGFAIKHYKIIAGGPLSGRRQILLGRIAANNFEKKVGDTFKINESTYRIVGLYETGIAMEDGGAVMTLTDAQSAFDKRNRVSYFSLKVKDARQIDAVKASIEAANDKVAAIRSGEVTKSGEMLDMYRSFGWFLGIFAVLVGGLGMMNTMVMSVLERTREIGVLRAVGWRRRRIVGMIFGEAVVLSLVGGILGMLLGVGLTLLVRLSPSVESLLQVGFTPSMFVEAMVVSLLLGTVGGLYPAWRASQLAPAEAMRYEGGAGGALGNRTRAVARLFSWGGMRNLWRRPARTLVTVIGIGIGVGFVVSLLGMTEGIKITFTRVLSAGESDLMAEQAKASDISVSAIDERTAERLATVPEVKSVSKVVLGIATAPGIDFLMVFGLDPREEYLRHYRVREGRLLERQREMILGRAAANSLGKGVGDSLRIGGSAFTVVGVYENGQVYEDMGSAVILRDAQQMFGRTRQVSLLGISLHDKSQAEAIGHALEAAFPELMITQPSKATERMQDFATTYAILNALVLLIVVVGGIVMMNAMLMSVFERTQEIGVLRALGWRRRRVILMVLGEALALSVLSALAGIGIGVGLNWLFALAPVYGAFLTPDYPPILFAQVAGLAVLLGALGGIYPAWRASGMRPIEALRYE